MFNSAMDLPDKEKLYGGKITSEKEMYIDAKNYIREKVVYTMRQWYIRILKVNVRESSFLINFRLKEIKTMQRQYLAKHSNYF